MNNNLIGKTGLSALFLPRRKEDSLHDHVRVMIQRVKNDFFKGMDDEQLMCLPDHVRPPEESWGAEFREKLDKPKAEGGFGTLEAALKEAERLWRENSPAYQGYRSVAKPGKLPNGRRNIRRARLEGDSEADYRRRIRETREAAAANRSRNERVVRDYRRKQSVILWQTLRPAIHVLAKRLSAEEGEACRVIQDEGVWQEIANHVDGYIPPRDDTSALTDHVLLEV
ncbi:Hypp4549 [Branchiostoma lanceolatum]|uniref:Hypp4549 protein n=1 Tax=Branchiostoma lanceolatum TaxID=7740 RepID=A0A8K0EW52_BRALA|nr:Hypp4549 [Branchiostoma lanceolatum]